MNMMVKCACLMALMVPMAGMAADQPKSASCYEIRYSLDFLDRYPMAPAICQEVVELNGAKYARMDAEVAGTEGHTLTVSFKNVFGTEIRDVDIRPVPGSKLTLNGKSVPWDEVKRGDSLTFWLPEKALYFVSSPGSESDISPIVLSTQ
ncbi:MAG: hypothetical protein ACREVZ_00045 [Burkholderiales bacterium]